MNYTQLKTLIQDYTENDETTFVATLDDFIRQAEERISHAMRLPDFRKNSTGTTSSGNSYLALPPDYLAAFSLASIVSNVHDFLLYKDVNFIREAFPLAATQGTPRFYGQWDDDTLLLGPTPNGNLTMELHYFAQPPSIVTNTTSWLGDNAESLLLYGCLVEAYTFMKGEPDLIELYETRYKEALDRFKDLGEARSRKDTFRQIELMRPPT